MATTRSIKTKHGQKMAMRFEEKTSHKTNNKLPNIKI
jgi:hypothetical protein